jgi:hypothetical protein
MSHSVAVVTDCREPFIGKKLDCRSYISCRQVKNWQGARPKYLGANCMKAATISFVRPSPLVGPRW